MNKRILAILLCFILKPTISSHPTSAISGGEKNTSSSNNVIYFDANSAGWENAEWVGFYIYSSNGYSSYDWDSKKTRGTDNDQDGIWEYDLSEHYIDLYGDNKYYIIFYTEDEETESVSFGVPCFGDRAYCDGYIPDLYDPSINNPAVYWRSADPQLYGMKMRFTAKGEIVGTVLPANMSNYDIFVEFIREHIDEARAYSGKSDQQIVDSIKEQLSLSDEIIGEIIDLYGIDVGWNPKVSISDYEGKNIIYLDTTAVSDKVTRDRYLTVYAKGKHTAKRLDQNIWIVDLDTIISDDGSSATSGDESYSPDPILSYIQVYGRDVSMYPCRYDESCYGETLVFSGKTVKRYDDNWYESYYAHWTNRDASIYGAVKGFDSEYNLIGEAVPNFKERVSLLRRYIEDIWPEIRTTTIDTDQYLIDEMATKLGMRKSDVACLFKEENGIWNPDDSFLPEGFSYDEGNYYLSFSNADYPCGYHSFAFDTKSGYYVIDTFVSEPYLANLDRYYDTNSGNSYSGDSSASSSGSSSSSSSGSSSGGSYGVEEPQHTFSPGVKCSVVKYSNGRFETENIEPIIPYYGSLYFFRSQQDNYCFGYNTYGEIGHSTSGEAHSSSYSSYYPLPTPSIKNITNTQNGIKITWDAVYGAEKYRVYIKGDDQWITAGDTTNTEFIYQNAKSGNAYTFTLRCVSADGSKHTSNYDDYGATIRYLDTPVVIKLESTSKGNRITWNPVGGNARYRVYVKSRNSWKALGDTYDTTFTHSSEGEGSIFAQTGVEYTYTVACLSYIGNTVTSPYNTDGWSIVYTGGDEDNNVGDTNHDGQISIGDVTTIQRHLAELSLFTDKQLALADTNSDGKVDISDATHLQKYLAEFDNIVLGKS